jgi:ADP-ribose pyrophosphatase YjhB (NUDIX family)
VDEGELPEAGAIRELAEEAGLVPTSALTLIGLYELPGFAVPALMISYACTVGDGEPVISHEHTASRWVEPQRMRDALAGETGFLGDIRADVERYLAWRARR